MKFFVYILLTGLVALLFTSACSDTETVQIPVDEINKLTFTGTDVGFSGPASTFSGRSELILVNQGQGFDNLLIAKLTGANTVDNLPAQGNQELYNNLPSWIIPIGGPGKVPPGKTSSITVNLEAGNYVLIRFGTDENNVTIPAWDLRVPFTVAQSANSLALEPDFDMLMNMIDFGYTVSDEYKPGVGSAIVKEGSHIIKITNMGKIPHEVILAKFDKGKRAVDYPGWKRNTQGNGGGNLVPIMLEDGTFPTTPPTATIWGGSTIIAANGVAYLHVDLVPANYLMYCTLPNPQTENPNFSAGMIEEFSVIAK
jgi:hypothetical protein